MRHNTWIRLVTVCCLFTLPLGCDVAVSVGDGNGNQNANDNTTDNDNANDNTVDNANDNTVDNANDNTVGNANDNTADDDSTFARFQDPDSDFSTTNVRDVDEEIIRFDTTTQSIVWAADDRVFEEGQWEVNGVLLGRGGPFQVRFGTKDGQRRAYFTETATATICNFVVTDSFRIFLTNTPVPQE